MVKKQLEGSAVSAVFVIILSGNYAVIFPWEPCSEVAVNSKILGVPFHYRKLANNDLKMTGREKQHFQAEEETPTDTQVFLPGVSCQCLASFTAHTPSTRRGESLLH